MAIQRACSRGDYLLKLPSWDRAQTRDPFYHLATGSGPSPPRPSEVSKHCSRRRPHQSLPAWKSLSAVAAELVVRPPEASERAMGIRRIVPNIVSAHPDLCREFYVPGVLRWFPRPTGGDGHGVDRDLRVAGQPHRSDQRGPGRGTT